jgi:hypothetical protein
MAEQLTISGRVLEDWSLRLGQHDGHSEVRVVPRGGRSRAAHVYGQRDSLATRTHA